MKVISTLIIFAFICMIKAETIPNFDTAKCADYEPKTNNYAFSLDFCKSTYYDKDQIARCCFIKYKEGDKRKYHCLALEQSRFNDIDKVIDDLESEGIEVTSIDCASNYLYSSFLLILALLI